MTRIVSPRRGGSDGIDPSVRAMTAAAAAVSGWAGGSRTIEVRVYLLGGAAVRGRPVGVGQLKLGFISSFHCRVGRQYGDALREYDTPHTFDLKPATKSYL